DRVCRGMCQNSTSVLAAGQVSQPRSHPAIARGELAFADFCKLADQDDAVAGEPPLHRQADAPQQRDRLAGEECRGIGAAENREAARLVEIGGDLCEKFGIAQPDRYSDSERSLDARREADEELRGTSAVKGFGAA